MISIFIIVGLVLVLMLLIGAVKFEVKKEAKPFQVEDKQTFGIEHVYYDVERDEIFISCFNFWADDNSIIYLGEL